MSYQVIARKYRPQSFADVVNQEHVKTTLENAIAQSRIAHGYIFSGQRGTGKTTIARIMARCLNCVQGPTTSPCGECASCKEISAGGAPDVIEIDAASNRGINEMRELRENVRYRPVRDPFKVFIIDEAHQITNEAFNALLKTIEEPPAWVVFILCTTESHKIPATIASRCQHFSFRSVDFEDLVARMQWICEQEGIEADADTLAIIAQAGEGSVRDSLSALDQAIACCGGKLTADAVRALLGSFSLDSMGTVAEALASSDSTRMLGVVDELERNGQNLQHFSRELSRYFRNLLVARIAGSDTRLIAASPSERQKLAATAAKFSEEDLTRYLQLSLDLFRDLQFSLQPRFHLEIGLVRLVHAGRLGTIEQALANLSREAPAPALQLPPRPPAASPGPASAPPRRGPSPFELDSAKKGGTRGPEAISGANALAVAPAVISTPITRDLLYNGLLDLNMTFTADALEDCEVTETASELIFRTGPGSTLSMAQADLQQVLTKLGARPLKLKFITADPVAPARVQAPAPAAQPSAAAGVTREALYTALLDLNMTFTADAVEQSEVTETAADLIFRVPPGSTLSMAQSDLQQALKKLNARPLKLKFLTSDAPTASGPVELKVKKEDEVTERALANPEVQRFRDLFGGEVRAVRNLKE